MQQIQHITIPYLEMGGGFLLGLSLGYALKKSFKGFLLIVGFGLIFMFVLESQGAISIDQIPLQDIISQGADKIQVVLKSLTNKLATEYKIGSISALAGFAVGIKTG